MSAAAGHGDNRETLAQVGWLSLELYRLPGLHRSPDHQVSSVAAVV